jgi:hypothetical protein
MKVRYIGAGDDPPARTVFRGIPFERDGEPVEVSDPDVLAKLSGNQCFEVLEDGASGRLSRTPVDGSRALNTYPHASPEDETANLKARIESAGYKVDGRWGIERLREEAANVDG